MSALRALVEREAPSVREVDLGAIDRRAHDLVTSTQSRARRKVAAVAVPLVVALVSVVSWTALQTGEDQTVLDAPIDTLDGVPGPPVLIGANAVGLAASDQSIWSGSTSTASR